MFNLVTLLLSLMLTASMLWASVRYTPADLGARVVATSQIQAALDGLQKAAIAYHAANSAYPPAATWNTALAPTYMYLPRLPDGMTLSYGTGNYTPTQTGAWFCISGPVTPAESVALATAAGAYSTQQAALTNACGAVPPGGSTGTALTFWLPLNP